MPTTTITCRFEVDVTFEVSDCESLDDALSRIAGKDIWQDYGMTYDRAVALNLHVLEEQELEVIDFEVYSDPSPTGRHRVSRDWDIHIEEG
jgi:hypothetical protein